MIFDIPLCCIPYTEQVPNHPKTTNVLVRETINKDKLKSRLGISRYFKTSRTDIFQFSIFGKLARRIFNSFSSFVRLSLIIWILLLAESTSFLAFEREILVSSAKFCALETSFSASSCKALAFFTTSDFSNSLNLSHAILEASQEAFAPRYLFALRGPR